MTRRGGFETRPYKALIEVTKAMLDFLLGP
jgi:hypothetical protein